MNKNTKIIGLLLGFLLTGFLLYYFRSIVSLILIAWVLSMIGRPLVLLLQRKVHIWKFRMGPKLAAALTLLVFYVVVILFFQIMVPMIVNQADKLTNIDYSALADTLSDPFNHLMQRLEKYGLAQKDFSLEDKLSKMLTGFFSPAKVGSIFSSLLSTVGSVLFAVFAVTFISFFFLQDQGLFSDYIKALLPKRFEKKVNRVMDELSELLTRYFGGLILQIAMVTLIVFLGLTVLGVENALLIGFIAGLINVIPYFGPLIGATFGVVITLSTNLHLEFYNELIPLLLKVVAVFAGMQLIDNLILQPFIFSKSVKAHPLEIFIVILAGAKINGIVGMMLAIPAYTVLRVIAKVFLSEFSIVKKITEQMEG